MDKTRLLLGATMLATAFGLLPGAPAHAERTYDWFLMTITAGPAGATNVGVTMSTSGAQPAHEPLALGVGASLDGSLLWMDTYNLGLGPRRITTSAPLGGVDIEVVPDQEYSGSFWTFTSTPQLDPGQTLSVLFFETGVKYVEPTVTSSVGSGDISVKTEYGAGSHTVVVADPADRGYAANVDGTAAGIVDATRTVPAGIAGAAVEECTACEGSWTAPDDREGTWGFARDQRVTATPLGPYSLGVTPRVSVGSASFAGPAGTWRFGWSGLDNQSGRSPVEYAYAPIGDAWSLFAAPYPVRPSATCDDGTTLLDQTVGGVHATVRTADAGNEHRVCVRVEDPTTHEGTGGALVVWYRSPLPVLGADANACRSQRFPNQIPGAHPFANLTVLGQPLVLDAYVGGSRAIACLTAGPIVADVVVPLYGVGVVSVEPDPST